MKFFNLNWISLTGRLVPIILRSEKSALICMTMRRKMETRMDMISDAECGAITAPHSGIIEWFPLLLLLKNISEEQQKKLMKNENTGIKRNRSKMFACPEAFPRVQIQCSKVSVFQSIWYLEDYFRGVCTSYVLQIPVCSLRFWPCHIFVLITAKQFYSISSTISLFNEIWKSK